MSEKPIREYDRLILRLPDGLRERIKEYAEINGRSMNAEAVAILQQGLSAPDAINSKALEEEVRRVQLEIDATAKQLHFLSDRRNRLKDAIGIAKGTTFIGPIEPELTEGEDGAEIAVSPRGHPPPS